MRTYPATRAACCAALALALGCGAAPSQPLTEGKALPVIVGSWERVFRPAGTRYLNDHTLARGRDGTWHLYGITHESGGMPQAEHSFLHATSRSLAGPWVEQPDILMAQGDETVLWAPYAFQRAPDRWTMLYWGGTADMALRRADSDDLTTWRRVATPVPGGRDPFVTRGGDGWMAYSVGVSATAHGRIVASTSADLAQWSAPVTVIEDPAASFGWGNLESPVVVPYGGWFYLFVTRTSASPTEYSRTMVFCSRDPMRFAWDALTEFRAHAAEVFEADGRWYVTSGGWTSAVGEDWRGLSLARIEWLPMRATD